MPDPPHPHPEVDEFIAKVDDLLPPEGADMPDEPVGKDPDAPDDWADPIEPEDDTIPQPGEY